MSLEFITIESHYGVPENAIRVNTRNQCSESFTGIINGIASILYPTEEFDIFLLPSERGSYKDIIKIVKKKPLESATAVVAVGTLVVGFLTYLDGHATHVHDEKVHIIDDASKCLALKQQMAELAKNYEVDNIPEDKINEVCGNLRLKKIKNDRLKTLQNDDMITSEQIIVKDSELKIIFDKKIERKDFEDQVEFLSDLEYTRENMEGVIELVSLVVKQKKEGKGIPWKGFYYGDDISDRGINILFNGENINFYMQDLNFKNKIDKHEIAFSNGDNINAVFDIRGSLNMDMNLSKSIYVKEVKRFNEDIIEHKAKIAIKNKAEGMIKNQNALF